MVHFRLLTFILGDTPPPWIGFCINMDPGAALVTAYPLPPDYFISLSEDEIRNMEPPLPPKDNLQSFGHPVLV